MRQKVVIVGGGVAGLTAAHELIEREYDVVVIERRPFLGGKAASYEVAVGGQQLPGEHGFRFFPGWYRNLPDTLKRISYQSEQDPFFEGKNVLENLVALEATVLAQYSKDPISAVFHLPRSATQLEQFFTFWTGLKSIGLPLNEALFFLNKIRQFLLTPEEVRRERYDSITWWDFLEADKQSPAFRVLIEATTRTTIAAKARQASAYTIAKVAIATFLDGFTKPDTVLNGPTSDAWLDPWVKFLRRKGVRFKLGIELASIQFADSGRSIEAITCNKVVEQDYLRLLHSAQQLFEEVKDLGNLGEGLNADVAANLRRKELEALEDRLREMLEPYPKKKLNDPDLFPPGVKPQHGIELALLLHRGLKLVRRCKKLGDGRLLRAFKPGALRGRPATVVGRVPRALDPLRAALRAALVDVRLRPETIRADHFIFALPVEQMAYYVNRSATLTHLAPELRNIVRLSESVDWMAGIQFYLKEPIDLPRASLICIDSEWALTAVQQTQFWRRAKLPASVHAVLSVDISDWSTPGRFNKLEASRCKPEQIAIEVWEQLKESLNRTGKPKILRDEMLLKGPGMRGSFALDESVVERFDRKKQSAFEKSAAVQLRGQDGLSAPGETTTENALLTGHRMTVNLEPLLINRRGSLKLRPEAQTSISNMFLAGDYVNTSTNLACMEGANESARLAVNAILNEDSSQEKRCEIFGTAEGDVLAVLSRLVEAGARATQLSDGPAGAAADAAMSWLNDKRNTWKKLWR